MQTNLQSFTKNILDRMGSLSLTFRDMNLDDLKDY